MAVAILDKALYTIGEAARLLEIRPSKLRRWMEGARVHGVYYPPVIRPEPTGRLEVTWAEFVEAGFLRQYRVQGVTLQRLRPFIERMREQYEVPYPLAHFRPLVDRSTRDLMVELKRLQDAVHLDEQLALVTVISGQLAWTDVMSAFLDKVDFDFEAIAERMHPLGKSEPVVIDPRIAFGIPQIHGIRTETLAEAVAAG